MRNREWSVFIVPKNDVVGEIVVTTHVENYRPW
jgi:hypothetical protein